jgi:hypothetical protein
MVAVLPVEEEFKKNCGPDSYRERIVDCGFLNPKSEIRNNKL